jgi:hypothetical protein
MIESTAVMHLSDGFRIAEIFRNQTNLITNGDATAAFSTATLQGKEAES